MPLGFVLKAHEGITDSDLTDPGDDPQEGLRPLV